MDKFEVTFRPSVYKDTKGIPPNDLRRILDRINSLAIDPHPPGSIKLSNKECYRIRQGRYRIIYEVIKNRLVILIIKIGHRRDIYKEGQETSQ